MQTRERSVVTPCFATGHAVRAPLKDGREQRVAGLFQNEAQAHRVEGELERILRLLEDSPS